MEIIITIFAYIFGAAICLGMLGFIIMLVRIMLWSFTIRWDKPISFDITITKKED